jgi:hypothetical protein
MLRKYSFPGMLFDAIPVSKGILVTGSGGL